MFNARIITLTPVHIGSGRILKKQIDYLHFSHLKNGPIALLDEEKVLAILGRNKLSAWMRAIEKQEDLLMLIRQQNTQVQPDNLAKRIIKVKDKPGLHGELYEQLTNGMGRPYIPGSSLKGSIRTALFTDMLRINQTLIKNLNPHQFKDKVLMQKLMATTEERDLEINQREEKGNKKTSNKDIFRFLHVGDIHFITTQAIMVKTMNLKKNNWTEDHSLSQWTECIPEGEVTDFRINFADDTLFSKNKNQKIQKAQTETIGKGVDLLRQSELLPIINNHTLNLLKHEQDFIQQENDTHLDLYAEQIEKLIDQTEQCKEGECVLRLGKHSGFLFMTGGWQEELMEKDQYNQLKRHVRHGKRTPDHLPLPKTRRFTAGGMPLGFIKLKLI